LASAYLLSLREQIACQIPDSPQGISSFHLAQTRRAPAQERPQSPSHWWSGGNSATWVGQPVLTRYPESGDQGWRGRPQGRDSPFRSRVLRLWDV